MPSIAHQPDAIASNNSNEAAIETLYANFVDSQLSKGYRHCMSNDFASLRQFEWWNSAVEELRIQEQRAAVHSM